MRFERLTDHRHKLYNKAMGLYSISFPAHEQREAVSQTSILCDDEYHFSLIYDDAQFVGILLYWETGDFLYVEHFCIFSELRNRKYGENALRLLGQCGKTVILEIDPPTDAIAVRRKQFYERCGFTENPYPHIHPPYHQGNTGHDLVIMSSTDRITPTAYAAFKTYLDSHVMNAVF